MKKIVILLITLSVTLMFSGTFSQPSKYEGKIVKEIIFSGLKNVDKEDLKYDMKTAVGFPLNSDDVRDDIKTIFNKKMFENVIVEIEEFGNGVRLQFKCVERPVVKLIEFKGTEELVEADLLTEVLVKEGDPLRKDILEKSVKKLKDKYNSQGLFNAIITYKVLKLQDEENAVKVQFIIDEGEEIKVQKISILGAKKIYPKVLYKLIETTEDGLFNDGSFKKDIYEQDKTKIVGFYKQEGYLDAQIIEEKVQYEWVNPLLKGDRGIFITLKIFEGKKYYFDRYTVKIIPTGKKPVYRVDRLMKSFELKNYGEVFNNSLFMQDKQMLGSNYAAKGYIFARVIPKQTITEKEVFENGKKIKKKFVRVDFTIYENTKAFIDQIIIKGNKKTKDKVIRREILVKEGELFNSRKVEYSRMRIMNLGYFKQVNIDARPGSREGYMNLIIDVEEQPTGTISLGGGYGTTAGFSIFSDVGENNLMGNGQRVSLRLEYGPQRSAVTLRFSEPWLFDDYPVGFESTLFYYLYSRETNSIFNDSSGVATYKQQSFGYSLGLSYRFWYFFNIGLGWRHSFLDVLNPTGNADDDTLKEASRPIQQKRTIYTYLYRDTRNNVMNPSAGTRVGGRIDYTGGLVLGGQDHFIRYYPEISLYFSPFNLPYLKTHPCVFELRGSAIFIRKPLFSSKVEKNQPWEDNKWVEEDDLLTMGGPESIRGWDLYDTALAESWRYNRLTNMVLYGLEFRVPIHPQYLWLAFFFDAGSLWSDKFWEKQLSEEDRTIVDEDLKTNNDSGRSRKLYRINQFFDVDLSTYFIYSYGFGFRIQIPMMPLRFWFGKKLLYNGHSFEPIGDFKFQFAIGDFRY